MNHAISTQDTVQTLDYFIYHINKIYKKFQYREIETCLTNLKAQENFTENCINLVTIAIRDIVSNHKNDADFIKRDEKTLNLSWIHKNENSGYISKVTDQDFSILKNQGYHIYWYIYKAGVSSPDQFAGAEWIRFYGCDEEPDAFGNYYITDLDSNHFDFATDEINDVIFYPNINKTKEQLKVIVIKQGGTTNTNKTFQKIAESEVITFINQEEIPRDDYIPETDLSDYLTPEELAVYLSDKDYLDENASALINYLKGQGLLSEDALSNYTPTENLIAYLKENNLFSEEVAKAIADYLKDNGYITNDELQEYLSELKKIDLNALSIKFNDNERGNYFIYNRAGNIVAEKDKELRLLTAVFDTFKSNIYQKADLNPNDFSLIQWSFPADSTMIQPVVDYTELKSEICSIANLSSPKQIKNQYKVQYNSTTDTFDFIAPITEGNSISLDNSITTIGFYIKKTLNRTAGRNNVFLTAKKNDGQTYTAQVQMHFGSAGTSGSDYTLSIEWDNNASTFDVGEAKINNNYKITGRLYLRNDQTGNYIQINNQNCTYQLQSSEIHNNSSNTNINNTNVVKTIETHDCFYPVILRDKSDYKFDCMYYYDARISENVPHYYYYLSSGNQNNLDWIDTKENIQLKYWIDCNWSEDYTSLYKYNFENNQFIKVATNEAYNKNTIYYTKRSTINNATEYKIKFLPVKVNSLGNMCFIYNRELYRGLVKISQDGAIFYYNNTDAGGKKVDQQFFNNNPNDTSHYYREQGNTDGSKRRAFIKINDNYIVDPYDEYHPEEIYYYPVFDKEARYQTNQNDALKIEPDSSNGFSIKVNQSSSIDNIINNLYLLQVSTTIKSQPLTMYYPIALKNTIYSNANIPILLAKGIDGPTEIRYSTAGDPDFIKDPFNIYLQEKTSTNKYQQINNKSFYSWQNKYPEATNIDKKFFPKLYDSTGGAVFQNPILIPFGIYCAQATVYGVQVKTIQSYTTSAGISIPTGTILWTQPIYIYQDNYPSTTLNKWKGTDIISDTKTGIVSASGFSAGKKEEDNTFTGVILGDWSKTDSDIALTKNTGIFGLYHNAMCYALRDDGTAFFGQDGRGRIIFDGNEAQIYSANWKTLTIDQTTNSLIQREEGIMLDLDDGILKIRHKKKRPTTTIFDQPIPISFVLNANANEKTFMLNVEYESPEVPVTVNSYDANNQLVTETLYTSRKNQNFKISSESPYLSLGGDLEVGTGENYPYSTGSGDNISLLIKYNHDYIRINEHGGYLASANFKPTISSYFMAPKTVTINNSGDTATNVYSKRADNISGYTGNISMETIYPDHMQDRTYHAWGDPMKQPLTGLVIDLTHGKIVLGNDAEIKGYQTGKWYDPSKFNYVKERVFHISNGSISSEMDNKGRVFSLPNSANNVGYFILAETISTKDSYGYFFNHFPKSDEYSTIFRVDWDGTVNCAGTLTAQSLVPRSSIKFKENITSIPDSNLLYQLQPVKFKYKTSIDYNYGFIAEEVYKVLPEIVRKNENNSNEIFGLDYNSIFTLAVAEIQKLRKELDIIKQKIEIKEEKA